MNTNFTRLVERIRRCHPQLDVRTDQCETVRIISGRHRFVAGIRQTGSSYCAKFISIDGSSPIADKLLASVEDSDLGRFEEDFLRLLSERCNDQ